MSDIPQRLARLRGPAMVRGERWGREVRRRRPGQVWPPSTDPRVREIARRWVEDMTSDRELVELLVTVCAEAAEREYMTPAGHGLT